MNLDKSIQIIDSNGDISGESFEAIKNFVAGSKLKAVIFAVSALLVSCSNQTEQNRQSKLNFDDPILDQRKDESKPATPNGNDIIQIKNSIIDLSQLPVDSRVSASNYYQAIVSLLSRSETFKKIAENNEIRFTACRALEDGTRVIARDFPADIRGEKMGDLMSAVLLSYATVPIAYPLSDQQEKPTSYLFVFYQESAYPKPSANDLLLLTSAISSMSIDNEGDVLKASKQILKILEEVQRSTGKDKSVDPRISKELQQIIKGSKKEVNELEKKQFKDLPSEERKDLSA